MIPFKRGFHVIMLCGLIGGLGTPLPASDLSIKAGLGYEFLSQRYFLDSAAAAGPDSTLAVWSLSSTYLDDLKGQITTSWHPLDDPQRLELRSSLEQSADFLRLKTDGHYRIRPGRSRIDLDGEAEWRTRVGHSDVSGESYLCTYTRSKGVVPIGHSSVSAVGRFRLETVDFQSGETLALDYLRIGGNLGVEKTFANYSWGEISLLYTARKVPDSTSMDYESVGIEGSFYGFFPTGQIDLSARFESKDYKRPNDQDDHRRIELYGRNQVGLGERWFTRQELDLEGMIYGAEDYINTNYLRAGGAAMIGLETNGLTIAGGPELEVLSGEQTEEDSLDIDAEDYLETGGKLDADFLGTNGFFLSMVSTTGYRTLRDENELQTSFWYERVYLLADIKILSVLNLSTLFSAEWEWHTDPKNDAELYLLSTNLTYNF